MIENRLKEIREDKDYTQNIVAKYLGISQVVYSRYETGLRIIPVDTLYKLADFYQVSLDYLLYRTDDRKPYPKSIVKK